MLHTLLDAEPLIMSIYNVNLESVYCNSPITVFKIGLCLFIQYNYFIFILFYLRTG